MHYKILGGCCLFMALTIPFFCSREGITVCREALFYHVCFTRRHALFSRPHTRRRLQGKVKCFLVTKRAFYYKLGTILLLWCFMWSGEWWLKFHFCFFSHTVFKRLTFVVGCWDSIGDLNNQFLLFSHQTIRNLHLRILFTGRPGFWW